MGASLALSQVRDVSDRRQGDAASSSYGVGMRDATAESTAFATFLKEARKARGVSVDDVAEHTSVTRATYFRWEGGEVASPNLRQVREVCVFLQVPPARAGIALGLLTPEDITIQPAEPFDPVVVEIGRILAEEMPVSERAALLKALDAALNLWRSVVSMQVPKEPSGTELGRRTRTIR